MVTLDKRCRCKSTEIRIHDNSVSYTADLLPVHYEIWFDGKNIFPTLATDLSIITKFSTKFVRCKIAFTKATKRPPGYTRILAKYYVVRLAYVHITDMVYYIMSSNVLATNSRKKARTSHYRWKDGNQLKRYFFIEYEPWQQRMNYEHCFQYEPCQPKPLHCVLVERPSRVIGHSHACQEQP